MCYIKFIYREEIDSMKKIIIGSLLLANFICINDVNKSFYYEKLNHDSKKETLLVTFDETISKNQRLNDVKLKNRGFNDFNLISSGKRNVYSLRVGETEKAIEILSELNNVIAVEKDIMHFTYQQGNLFDNYYSSKYLTG